MSRMVELYLHSPRELYIPLRFTLLYCICKRNAEANQPEFISVKTVVIHFPTVREQVISKLLHSDNLYNENKNVQ
jgi:hypothetical protein